VQVLFVVLKRAAVDQDVVEEDDDTLAQEGKEGGIHGSEESSWRASQAKWHYLVLPVARVRLERHLVFIPWSEANLVIAHL
jgi:hypothetical protein